MADAAKALKPTYTVDDVNQLYDEPFQHLKKDVANYVKKPVFDLLDKAYHFAIEKHIRQVRRSGDPYFDHLFNVTAILVDLKMDVITLCSGLLHDVLEDTDTTVDEFRDVFGDEITNLVNGVTKITELSAKGQKVKQSESFRKMILSSANDIRVILIKFADRLHNMRTLHHMPAEKRTRIATETIEVYAPLAHRFGLQRIKVEYEDLSLKYLDSDAFYFLQRKIEETEDQRKDYIAMTISPIESELAKSGIEPEIYGRPKHYYSIYNKMRVRNKPFEEIYDLLAIRIIVEKVEACYFALGVVHSMYIPVADRFKDYIATPKINGYQSLHTTVIGPEGRMVEIQIRTQEMHIHAEEGIAAHWRYKYESKSVKHDKNDPLSGHIAWLRQFIERQNEDDSEEFFDNFKIDLFQDEVFVYSPKGDLFTLPKGSTAVDFAFHIHSNVGYNCTGAKINGKITPLKAELNNGDVIHIITNKSQKPNPDWLNFVKTSKARHYIKRYMKQEAREQNIQIGQDIFTEITKRLQLDESQIDYEALYQHYNKSGHELFLAGIGSGEISIESLNDKLSPERKKKKQAEVKAAADQQSTIDFLGIQNLLITYAKCCNPIPGDPIRGYVTAGRGITIHRIICKNLTSLEKNNSNRIININWNFISQTRDFTIVLRLTASDRNFLLRDITNVLSKIDVNLRAIDMSTDSHDHAFGTITIQVNSTNQLDQVVSVLRKIPSVMDIEREENSSQSD